MIIKFCQIDEQSLKFWRSIVRQVGSNGNPFQEPLNIVSNIEARSGNLGWTMAEDLSCMEKNFHFDSFEQGNAFV